MVREIDVLVGALDVIEGSYLVAQGRLRAAKRRLSDVQWQRQLAISALRRYLREALGSAVVDAFTLYVPFEGSSKWRLLSRLAMGEERIEVPLGRIGLLILEVRCVGGELQYRAWRTSEGEGTLFKDQAQRIVSEVELVLGREVPFEEDEEG